MILSTLHGLAPVVLLAAALIAHAQPSPRGATPGSSPAQAGVAPAATPASARPELPLVEVWKEASCGCCKDWVKHLEASGFKVRVFDTGNSATRARLGMPAQYGSCHTARVGGYVIEGHVPAREIQRLLKQRPAAVGLAVPAMPIGSPGMDGPEYGARRDPYDVLLVQKSGTSTVFQTYR